MNYSKIGGPFFKGPEYVRAEKSLTYPWPSSDVAHLALWEHIIGRFLAVCVAFCKRKHLFWFFVRDLDVASA